VQRCECPVMVVKRDYSSYRSLRPIVGLALDANAHGDRTFTWLLKQADLPANSQLYVIHITPKKTDKPDARRFLAALKPKCMESKRLYAMASALVSYDKGTVSDGLLKFCHDKDVATLLIASKGERHHLRLSKSITDECLRNSSLDILVWQDEQTRIVSSSPYIKSFAGAEPPPLRLQPWDNCSKAPDLLYKQPENQKDESQKDENQKIPTKESKRKNSIPRQPDHPRPSKNSIPHQPDHPRPSKDTALAPEDKPLAPIADSYTVPVHDPTSVRKQRRKSSLKYWLHDQIAKGKTFFEGDTVMEPLSP